MTLNRREFVALSSLGFVTAFGPKWAWAQGRAGGAAQQPPVVPEFKALRRNVGTFTARGGTIGYLITPDAVVVVDSQFADTAAMFVEGLKPKTTRKIDFLINSHHHGDHTGGNKVMQPSVSKIVAHENVPALQKRASAGPNEANQAYADTTFAKDWKASVGSETVSARYYGPAHTSGDIAITFERANIVHLGDLMSFQRNPRADRPAGASVMNWVRVLENVVKDHGSDTLYIFGHSKVGERVTGSSRDLLGLRDYLSAMVDFTRKQIAAGTTQEALLKTPAIPGFESYEGTPTALEATYLELTGKG
jgi:glyoxylase-like metal-dependent hydrolase (beta-lactamase superfamily II)